MSTETDTRQRPPARGRWAAPRQQALPAQRTPPRPPATRRWITGVTPPGL